MRLLVDISYGKDAVDEGHIEALCGFVAERLGVPEDAEVSITFVDNEEMASLNTLYRGKEGPTDVLSFECDSLDDGFPGFEEGGAAYSMGDIVIAPDVAAAQAPEYGNTMEEELDMLVVHGMLHLDGYDHIDDEEAEEMEALQADILSGWVESMQTTGGAQ